MPYPHCGHRNDPASVAEIADVFAHLHPDYRLGYSTLERAERYFAVDQGARLIWIDRGDGEVWLERDYRTNEGDGLSLPSFYQPDALSKTDRDALTILTESMSASHPRARAALQSIMSRYDGQFYRGELAGDVWRLMESGLASHEWMTDPTGSWMLHHLLRRGYALGWSTKTTPGSFEPIKAGDQLLITPEAPLRVRGAFGYWWIETPAGKRPPGPSTRRLHYLKDTAGGCAPGFDAFRRLTLTWQFFTDSPDNPDGVNVLNSHIVNIAAEQSRTHYHPNPPIGGGTAQTEFYFVLDHADLSLHRGNRGSVLHAFPDINDWSCTAIYPLQPGSVVLIPPNTGHRGLNTLVNVVTIPGFKPGNEVYVDALIAAQTGGQGLFNAAWASAVPHALPGKMDATAQIPIAGTR